MPHHFKWINRATLLFNLAAAELLGGCVRARACLFVCVGRGGRCVRDQRCESSSVVVTGGLTDGQREGWRKNSRQWVMDTYTEEKRDQWQLMRLLTFVLSRNVTVQIWM